MPALCNQHDTAISSQHLEQHRSSLAVTIRMRIYESQIFMPTLCSQYEIMSSQYCICSLLKVYKYIFIKTYFQNFLPRCPLSDLVCLGHLYERQTPDQLQAHSVNSGVWGQGHDCASHHPLVMVHTPGWENNVEKKLEKYICF